MWWWIKIAVLRVWYKHVRGRELIDLSEDEEAQKFFAEQFGLFISQRDLIERDRRIQAHLDARYDKRPLTSEQKQRLADILAGNDRAEEAQRHPDSKSPWSNVGDGNTNYPGS